MDTIIVTRRILELLKQMKVNGFVTRRTQKIFSSIQFYSVIWRFRDLGLVKEVGQYNGNKKWALTDKGEEFFYLTKRLFEIMEEDNERKGSSA